MMMTLDGFVAGSQNELDWVVWEEEMDRDASLLIDRADAMLVGYGAYKDMANYWPNALQKATSEAEKDFAKRINAKHKIIVSQQEQRLLWEDEEQLSGGDLKSQIYDMKSKYDTIVAYGGVGLAQSLINEGLVDEYELIVSPVALGKGKALFSLAQTPQKFASVRIKQYSSGAYRLFALQA